MKNLRNAFFSLLALTFASVAIAEEAENPWSVGILIGESNLRIGGRYYDVPLDGSREGIFWAHKASSVGLTITGGYLFTENWGLEAQIASVTKADTIFRGMENVKGETEMTVSTSAYGAYGVFKMGGDAFLKARLGVGITEAEFETDHANQSYSKAGISWGLSVGQKFGPGNLEFMYMRYPSITVPGAAFTKRFDSGALPNGNGEVSVVSVDRKQSHEYFTIGYVFTF